MFITADAVGVSTFVDTSSIVCCNGHSLDFTSGISTLLPAPFSSGGMSQSVLHSSGSIPKSVLHSGGSMLSVPHLSGSKHPPARISPLPVFLVTTSAMSLRTVALATGLSLSELLRLNFREVSHHSSPGDIVVPSGFVIFLAPVGLHSALLSLCGGNPESLLDSPQEYAQQNDDCGSKATITAAMREMTELQTDGTGNVKTDGDVTKLYQSSKSESDNDSPFSQKIIMKNIDGQTDVDILATDHWEHGSIVVSSERLPLPSLYIYEIDKPDIAVALEEGINANAFI